MADEEVARKKQALEAEIPHFLELANDPNWIFTKKKNDCNVYWMRHEGSPLILIKGEGVVDATVQDLMTFCSKVETACSIDPMFLEGSEFEDLGGGHVHVYVSFSMPPMIANRDFVYHGFDKILEGGIGVSFGRSVVHPAQPEKHGFVRGHINSTGYVFRPVEGDPVKTLAQYVVHVDPKGWIPTWAVNMSAADQGSNVDKMQKYFAARRKEGGEAASAAIVKDVSKKRKKKKKAKKNKKASGEKN